MSKSATIAAAIVMLAGLLGGATALYFSTWVVADTTRSGLYLGHHVWDGEITITGDTMIVGGLTLNPGTIVRFAAGDDQGRGEEVPADGFNDDDPTRLRAYGETHGNILVIGRVEAVGSEELPIVFTSASDEPRLADWEAVLWSGNRSVFDHVVVEYSRNGLNPIGNQPESVVRESVIRHTLWGGVSSGHSTIRILNNRISDCGHEGIDVQGGDQVVRGNVIEDCHAGIVLLGGSPVVEDNVMRNVGDGIHVAPGATPKLGNNVFEPYPLGTVREWRYGDFSYTLDR